VNVRLHNVGAMPVVGTAAILVGLTLPNFKKGHPWVAFLLIVLFCYQGVKIGVP